MSPQRRDLHRALAESEQALRDVRSQLQYEQANRRKFEADYRAEHLDYLTEVEAERDNLRVTTTEDAQYIARADAVIMAVHLIAGEWMLAIDEYATPGDLVRRACAERILDGIRAVSTGKQVPQ